VKPLRCLLTAGPTREHLDPIRYLSNGSSGKMGYALAIEAVERGFDVDLVSGPVAQPAPPGVRLHRVISAEEMYRATAALFQTCHVFLAVAAVADYRPRQIAPHKVKKAGGPLVLELEPTIDILKTLAAQKTVDQLVVGFAAETQDVERYALRKLQEKQLDWIVANDVSRPELGMNADDNAVICLGSGGQRRVFGPADKRTVAKFILDTVLEGRL